ncbi:MAG: hypothetical protein JXR96_23135 [Deltaproteobacteria bacterium]|nr:hypothetical protein [Deltaproteobacteria bacterium]
MAGRSARWPCALALLALGCHPTPNMRGPRDLDAGYRLALEGLTRSAQVVKDLNSVMTVHATMITPEFKRALTEQYIHIFEVGPDKPDSDLERVARSQSDGYEFFVFADLSERAWNDLDDRDSVWRMTLRGAPDQPGITPLRVHRFNGRGPNVRAFFPYLHGFGRAYLVVFPRVRPDGAPLMDPAHGELLLKLSSVFGSASLTWKVSP